MKQPATVTSQWIGLCACLCTLGVCAGAAGQPPIDGNLTEATVYYDYLDESGKLAGRRLSLVVPRPDVTLGTIRSAFTTILDNGPPSNRVDLVFVGDGYTAGELGLYAGAVDNALASLIAAEPFQSYSPLINVHRVDVISNDSGVDHDPVYPIWRDTAMDMGFWCSGMERLLCIDLTLAYQFAYNAPDVDQVLAAANSTKYGGAAYRFGTDGKLVTFSAGNFYAGETLLHEIGHSLGNLADEYDYGDGTTYTGPEPVEPNISILTAPQMQATGTKWAAWIGVNDPSFDGYHSTYEGAFYHLYGIYRPTILSKMREINRPYNHPSVEAFIIELWKIIHPIDDATPTSTPLTGSETVVVTLVQPLSHDLDVQWYLDGGPIAGATATQLDLSTLSLAPGTYIVTVQVVDNTDLVRDETARNLWMHENRSWDVIVAPWVLGDMDCNGIVNDADIPNFITALIDPANFPPGCEILNGDMDGSGIVNGMDTQGFVDALTN